MSELTVFLFFISFCLFNVSSIQNIYFFLLIRLIVFLNCFSMFVVIFLLFYTTYLLLYCTNSVFIITIFWSFFIFLLLWIGLIVFIAEKPDKFLLNQNDFILENTRDYTIIFNNPLEVACFLINCLDLFINSFKKQNFFKLFWSLPLILLVLLVFFFIKIPQNSLYLNYLLLIDISVLVFLVINIILINDYQICANINKSDSLFIFLNLNKRINNKLLISTFIFILRTVCCVLILIHINLDEYNVLTSVSRSLQKKSLYAECSNNYYCPRKKKYPKKRCHCLFDTYDFFSRVYCSRAKLKSSRTYTTTEMVTAFFTAIIKIPTVIPEIWNLFWLPPNTLIKRIKPLSSVEMSAILSNKIYFEYVINIYFTDRIMDTWTTLEEGVWINIKATLEFVSKTIILDEKTISYYPLVEFYRIHSFNVNKKFDLQILNVPFDFLTPFQQVLSDCNFLKVNGYRPYQITGKSQIKPAIILSV